MIHITKDKVVIENMLFLTPDNGIPSICLEKDSIPVEVTENIFLSNNTLYKMCFATSFIKKLTLCIKYLRHK